MFSTKTRNTIIALSVVGGALAFSGVASAAIPVHLSGAVTTTVAAPPIATRNVLDRSKVGAGGNTLSTGQCESLADTYNTETIYAHAFALEGDPTNAAAWEARASQTLTVIENNCLIVE